MSTKAQAILRQFETLPPAEQRELWRQLSRRVEQASDASAELYGEPLTEDDIAESARVTFATLDQEEARAEPG